MELELAVLLALSILGQSNFAPFEIETPGWRKTLKWVVLCGITLLASRRFGHYALAIPGIAGALGLGVHFWWCNRNGIDPWHATPRRRYYALRHWPWPTDESSGAAS